jgi:spermidine synthase
MSRTDRFVLRFAVFAAGALLMALEVAAFRIIGKTFGAALRETTTVISVFLAAMSVGYWAGGRAGDRWPRATTLAAVLFGAAGTLLVVPWVDAVISPRIAASELPLFAHAFLATTVLFAFPTFLLAATSPIAIRLFTTSAGESGATAGSISAVSTVGSIAGSIATAFFLIDWLASIARTVLFVALGACATAVLVMICTTRARRAAVTVSFAALLLILTTAFLRSSSLDRALLAPLPGMQVLFVGDSPYHRITVREHPPLREMQFNVAIQSRMRINDHNGPGLGYIAAMHVGPLLRPGFRRVLLIGLGGATMPKQFLRFYPEATIDVVEIDPLVVEVARRWFAMPNDPRLRVHVADGRTFLTRSKEQWDLIVIDAYTTNRYGDTIPPHLTTREFFEEASRHLAANGIVHFHCTFSRSRLMPALEKTLRAVYPYLARTNGELLASRQPLELRPDALLALAQTSPAARLPFFTDALRAWTAVHVAADAPLLTDDYAPVDTLLR